MNSVTSRATFYSTLTSIQDLGRSDSFTFVYPRLMGLYPHLGQGSRQPGPDGSSKPQFSQTVKASPPLGGLRLQAQGPAFGGR